MAGVRTALGSVESGSIARSLGAVTRKSVVSETYLVVLPLVGSTESFLHSSLHWRAASRCSIDLHGKSRSTQRALCLDWLLADTPSCLDQESTLDRHAPKPHILGRNRRDCCREPRLV